MRLTTELLHQIGDPNLSANERALVRCQLARRLEEAGDYELAREAMGELWREVGERPALEGLLWLRMWRTCVKNRSGAFFADAEYMDR